MKKQARGGERTKVRKSAVKDLAPATRKAAGVKAGAVDAFAATPTTGARGGHEKWIEVTSISGIK
jgi:hypothetical protein